MLFVPSQISYKTILVSDEKPGALECAAYKTPRHITVRSPFIATHFPQNLNVTKK